VLAPHAVKHAADFLLGGILLASSFDHMTTPCLALTSDTCTKACGRRMVS
jgi:hypothetical protein